MKKILSLLVLLVTTLSAFALDFTDYRKVTLGSYTPTESNDAKLSVTDNGDGTYNVTFNDIINKDGSYTDNYGTFTFSNVSGSKSGDVTTVTATDVTGTVSGGTYNITEFTNGNLSLKDGKAYATMTATCRAFYSNYTFDVVFGTDEGFDGGSTGGGGETGGETSSIVTVKENFQSTQGEAWGENVTIDWNTQKLVASVNLASTGNDKGFLGVTKQGQTAGWNDYGIIFYNDGNIVQGYAPGQADNGNTGKITKGEDPVRFEISKEGGVKCQGNVVIPAALIAHLTNQSNIVVGAADKVAGAFYNYIKVVPLEWTETTEPEVTVKEEKTFNEALYMGGQKAADATVVVKKMSDETINMSLQFNGYEYKSTELTKGTDTKGRTTYTGKVSYGEQTYDVAGVVYEKDGTARLYMTMTTGVTTVVVGEDPDYVAPAEPEDVTLWENYQADGNGFSNTATIDWNKQKIVASIDFSNGGNDKDILAMTTGESFAAFETSTYRTMHWYCQQSVKQMSGFFAKTGAGNNNTGRFDVADCLAKFEISKAEGLKVNGEVKMSPTVLEELFASNTILIGSGESPKFSTALYNYVKVVSLDWKEPTTPDTPEPVVYKNTLKVVRGTDTKTYEDAEVSVLAKGEGKYEVVLPEFADMDVTPGTIGKLTFEANGVEENGTLKLTATSAATTQKGGTGWENATFTASMDATVTGETLAGTFTVVYPQDVTNYTYTLYYGVAAPDVITEKSNKTYTSNLRILDGETTVVEEAEANVNIVKYSDESYKVTLKNVNMLNKTQDLVFVGKALIEEAPTEATEPLTIIAKSDEATTAFFGEEMNGTFEITEVSAEEIKMGFVLNNTSLEYQGEFNYTEEEEPEVYTSNLHIYDAAAPETDLFQADQAKVEFLATATGEFKLTLKDVTLNEKTQDLVFTGALPTPQPGGQDPLAEEGEGEVTPAEPAMVLNATADEATTNFFGVATYPTAVFNVSYDKNDNFMMTFTIAAGAKNYGGEFNYEKKNPDTPDPELFSKENYVADGTGFEWNINVDWDTQKIVMSIDPSTCTGNCEDVIGLGAVPTAWDNTLHLYRTSADQMLQGYFQTSASNNNTGKFAETTPFLVEVSKAQGFVVNDEVKIASDAMSYLFTLSTVKMGTGEGKNDKSRATYNYVKVVDKDWTAPKDPDTGINATTVAEGEVEFFTVNGVKLNKLQKGLNIVRTADGKVKKVLVK